MGGGAPPHELLVSRVSVLALAVKWWSHCLGCDAMLASVPGLPRSFTYAQFISACGPHIRPGLKYHVRLVGGAIGKALLLFPEARSPSHLVEELLASRIICTTYGFLSIWLLR